MSRMRHAAISEWATPQQSLTVEETDDYFVIRGVRVLNEQSRNGGKYTRRARESAARLLNNLPVAIEHTDGEGRRRYLDRIGQLREGRLTSDAQVEGTLYVNKGSAHARQIAVDAKHFPANVCLSIELPEDGWVGEDNRPAGGYIVEDITRMDDCALVARGGTTNTLFEGHQARTQDYDEDDMSTQSPAQPANYTQQISETVRASIAEAEEKRKVTETIESLKRQVEDKDAVIKTLQEQLSGYKQAEERRAKAAKIIEQAKTLKAGDISEEYAMSLAKLDESEVERTLKDRASLLAKAGGPTEPGEPNFHAPSVGGDQPSRRSPFPWVD